MNSSSDRLPSFVPTGSYMAIKSELLTLERGRKDCDAEGLFLPQLFVHMCTVGLLFIIDMRDDGI